MTTRSQRQATENATEVEEEPCIIAPLTFALGRIKWEHVAPLPTSYFQDLTPAQHRQKYRHINQPHPSLTGKVILKDPFRSTNKRVPWWFFFSILDPYHPSNDEYRLGAMQFCNLCGRQVKMGQDFSSSCLMRHVRRNHRAAYRTFLPKFGGEPLSESEAEDSEEDHEADRREQRKYRASRTASQSAGSGNDQRRKDGTGATLVMGSGKAVAPGDPYNHGDEPVYGNWHSIPNASDNTARKRLPERELRADRIKSHLLPIIVLLRKSIRAKLDWQTRKRVS